MNVKRQTLLVFGFALFAMVSFSACTSVHKPSGYLNDYSGLQKGTEFKQERISEVVDFSKFTKVKVNPPELKYFENINHEYDDLDIQYLSDSLELSLEKELGKKYLVLGSSERADSSTLVISPALVYATSPERLINALTIWFIGFQFSKGVVAFEAKLEDGGTGREIAAVAEKRKGGGGLADPKSILIGGFFKFTHAEGAFKRWGKNFVDLTEKQEAKLLQLQELSR